MTHTKGPWKVDKGCFTVRAECLPVVAATGLDHGVVCVAVESTSDAQLIAAAPELLAALRHCERALEFQAEYFPEESAARQASKEWAAEARAAISKAEGKERP